MNAVRMKNLILAALAAVGTFVTHALGGWDEPMKLLVALMLADFFTGVAVAVFWKKSPKTESGAASSAIGFKGLLKKGAIVLVILIAVRLDNALGTTYVRLMAILFFMGNEGLSLLENLGLMGVPFPGFIKRMFEVLREKGDNGEESAT